jgi:hypothetical protein
MSNPQQPPGSPMFRPPQRPNRTEEIAQNKQQRALNEVANRLGGLTGEPVQFHDNLPLIDQPPQRHQVRGQGMNPAIDDAAWTSPGLPDDHAQVMAEIQQPQPPPQQRQAPQMKTKTDHSVILELLQDFGVKDKEYKELTIQNTKGKPKVYLMTKVPDDVTVWSISDAQTRIPLEGDTAAMTWYQSLIACCAVVAIDGVPVYELFGISPTREEEGKLSGDKYDISVRIRKLAGRALAELLYKNTQAVLDKMSEFYVGSVSGNDISSSYDESLTHRTRYVCPIDGCTTTYIETPPENGQLYCKIHAEPMIAAADLKDELNLPLP